MEVGDGREDRGWAVQVDPIKPTLKAPGTKRSKLKYDNLLSILLQFCFQFQFAPLHGGRRRERRRRRQQPGRAVKVDPMKPMLKAPGAKRLKL